MTQQAVAQAPEEAESEADNSSAASTWARTRRSLGEGRWSLRRRLGAAFVIAGALLVLGCVLGAIALNTMISAVNLEVSRLDPADRLTTTMLNAMLNEETGVRGYVITKQHKFLAPYHQGIKQSAKDFKALQQRLDTYPRLRNDLSLVQRKIALWRSSYADPTVAAVLAGHQVSDSREAAGKDDFDQVRAAIGALGDEITAERATALTRLHTATDLVLIVAITGAVLLIAGAAAAWTGLVSWVIRPLADLGDQAQVVASGGLDHRLDTRAGPREIAELAADMEAMRRQLSQSLDDVSVKAAELQRSNRELEQFAYVASHDLQEPLRKVASFCQMLESRYAGQLDDRAKQYIFYAVDGAKRMQLLINELLMFSRVGQAGTTRAPVDMNDAALRAVEALDATIEDTDADVIIGDLPTVTGDQALLTQLFQNLIANSIKFRRVDETPVVRITAERMDDFWQFACQDNGIGIAPAYAERVFVIFQRLHPREAYPGTGIGLAMCRKIVDFHGGQIWIDEQDPSVPGTTIRWTLPAGDK